jgi:hypothetical protein
MTPWSKVVEDPTVVAISVVVEGSVVSGGPSLGGMVLASKMAKCVR